MQSSFVHSSEERMNRLQFHAHFDIYHIMYMYQADCTENNPITSNMLFIGAIYIAIQCPSAYWISVELLIVELVGHAMQYFGITI